MRKLYWKESDAIKAVQTISGIPYLSSADCDSFTEWDEECDRRHVMGEVQCYRFEDSDDKIGWYESGK